MGRMLEALSRGRAKLVRVEEPTPIAIHQPIHPPIPSEELTEENIPFVEVGGPNREPVTNLTIRPSPKPPLESVPIPDSKPTVLKSTWSEKVEGNRYLSILFQPVIDRSIADASKHIFANDLVTFHRPDHPISQQYRSLMKQLDESSHPSPRSLFFTAPHVESGTTTVVLNLAIVLLQTPGNRVLVIDANPAQSSMADRLGVASSPGLHELFHRQLPLGVTIHRSILPGLSVLPSGRGEGVRGAEDRDRLFALLTPLRSRFDWILIDGPEWGDGSIPIWSNVVDSTYLVVRQTDTNHPEVESAHEALQRDGKLKGYIMTQA